MIRKDCMHETGSLMSNVFIRKVLLAVIIFNFQFSIQFTPRNLTAPWCERKT